MKLIVGLLIAMVLVGCDPTITTKYRVGEDRWYDPCDYPPPPDKETYLNATERERNLMWSQVYAKGLSINEVCNKRIDASRAFHEVGKQHNQGGE